MSTTMITDPGPDALLLRYQFRKLLPSSEVIKAPDNATRSETGQELHYC